MRGGGIECITPKRPLPISSQAAPERMKLKAAIGRTKSVIAAST